MKAFFDGKKTYIAAAIVAAVAAAEYLGYPVPEYVLVMLNAFGLYGMRSAIGKAGR
jgi:hypothetical protein